MGYLTVVNPTLANGPFIGVPPFVSPTILTGTSQDANYLRANLIDGDLDTYWRATTTAQQDIDFDLLTAYANPVVFVFGSNFETCSFYTDSSSSFTSPPFSLTSQSIYKDTRTRIRAGWFYLNGANHRYLRMRIPNQTLDSGVAVPTFSTIIVCPFAQLVIPATYHQLPIDVTIFRPSEVVQKPGGGTRFGVNFGRRRVRLDLPNQIFYIDDEEKVLSITDADENQNLLFFENLAAPTVQSRTTDSSRVYLVKRIGEYAAHYVEQFIETGWVFEQQ